MTVTVADWITYAADRGRIIADEPATAQALVRGSDYIRTRYLTRVSDAPEAAVDEATYIAAGYELDTPGFWSATYKPSEAKVLTRVGEIQWTPTGQAGGQFTGLDALMPTSPAIEALLMPYARYGVAVMVV